MNCEVRRAGRELNRPVGKAESRGNAKRKLLGANFLGHVFVSHKKVTRTSKCATKCYGWLGKAVNTKRLKACGLQNTSLYFALRAALRAFNFDPIEISPAQKHTGMTGVVVCQDDGV